MTLAQVDATALAPYLAGPGAAVVVLLLVLGGLYKFATTYLLPLANRALDSHLHRIDKLISANQEESKAITRTLASIDRRLARLEGLTDGAPLAPLAPMGDK